jgi:hypothetical protein
VADVRFVANISRNLKLLYVQTMIIKLASLEGCFAALVILRLVIMNLSELAQQNI